MASPHRAAPERPDVVSAEEDDIGSWLEIVREVEPLFGPMPNFEATLRRAIAGGTAVCVHDGSGAVVGAMLVSGPDRAAINWLAVRATHRRRGIGRALVQDALRRFPAPSQVTVDTFGEGSTPGEPARQLYASFGFVAGEQLENGPEGGTRQRFRLVRP